PYDDMSFYLGTGQLLILVFGLFIFIRRTVKLYTLQPTIKRFLQKGMQTPTLIMPAIFGLFFFIAAFMATSYSKFIWDILPFFAYIQFPWRWLSVASLFLALCACALIFAIENRIARFIYAFIGVVLLVVFSHTIFKPEKHITSY